jgi:hypothetical protein
VGFETGTKRRLVDARNSQLIDVIPADDQQTTSRQAVGYRLECAGDISGRIQTMTDDSIADDRSKVRGAKVALRISAGFDGGE